MDLNELKVWNWQNANEFLCSYAWFNNLVHGNENYKMRLNPGTFQEFLHKHSTQQIQDNQWN